MSSSSRAPNTVRYSGCTHTLVAAQSLLVSVNDDRTLKFWNIPTGREIGSYPMATSFVRLGFAPDGGALTLVYINKPELGCRFWKAPAVSDYAGNPGN